MQFLALAIGLWVVGLVCYSLGHYHGYNRGYADSEEGFTHDNL